MDWVRDADLYEQPLGLESPWKVTRVTLGVKGEMVDVYLGHEKVSSGLPYLPEVPQL